MRLSGGTHSTKIFCGGDEESQRGCEFGSRCIGACGISYILVQIEDTTRQISELCGTYDRTH